jgi:Fur family transcriptional regulator, ferric uptake regulator
VNEVDISGLEAEVERRLQDHGQHLTGRRRLLLSVLRSSGPQTAADIAAADQRLHLSSIYRNLQALEVAGIVTRLPGPTGENHYELADALTEHHHHLVCRHCGRLEDCVLPDGLERSLDDAARTTGRRHRFQVDGHRIDLLGACADCA